MGQQKVKENVYSYEICQGVGLARSGDQKGQTLDSWLAAILLLLSVGVIYASLIQILLWLFRRYRMWFFAVLILMAPFGFVLAQATSLINFVWMLALTPFYGVFVLCMVATEWMVRFYCAAFAFLMLAEFVFHRRTWAAAIESAPSFDPFWHKHLKVYTLEPRRGTFFVVLVRRFSFTLRRIMRRYWTIAVSIALIVLASSTFVSASSLRDPTYGEAMRFVASDKTESHVYMNGTYTCVNFATDFQESACKSGFKCGIVTAFFPDQSSHDLNCFNTTDNGMVYVEPQTGQIVSLRVGQLYSGPDWVIQAKNATVVGFYVTWPTS